MKLWLFLMLLILVIEFSQQKLDTLEGEFQKLRSLMKMVLLWAWLSFNISISDKIWRPYHHHCHAHLVMAEGAKGLLREKPKTSSTKCRVDKRKSSSKVLPLDKEAGTVKTSAVVGLNTIGRHNQTMQFVPVKNIQKLWPWPLAREGGMGIIQKAFLVGGLAFRQTTMVCRSRWNNPNNKYLLMSTIYVPKVGIKNWTLCSRTATTLKT